MGKIVFHICDGTVFIHNNKYMVHECDFWVFLPENGLNWCFNLQVFRYIKEYTTINKGGMKCSQLMLANINTIFRHEILLNEIRMFTDSSMDVSEDDTFFF